MLEEQGEVSTTVLETEVKTEDLTSKELAALKNKNQELLNDLAKLKQFRNSIDELGGLDQIKEMVKAKKESQVKALEDSGDINAIKRQYQEEISSLHAKIEKFNQERVETKVTEKLRVAVEAAGGTWELLAPAVKRQIRTDVIDDDIAIEVLDDSGHTWIKEGRDARIEDLVEKLRIDPIYGRAFDKTVVRTGSGATSSKRKPETNPWQKEHADLSAQTKIWLDNPDRARRMMAEAGVAVPVTRRR